MKTTLTTSQAADILYRDENAGWTYHGARALVEYLEQYEDETGEEMELDIVAIRCDFSEYESALDCYAQYEENTDGQNEGDALAWLEDHTSVISFDGGIIIQDF